VQIRNLDPMIWETFKQKVFDDFGKSWGRLPTPRDSKKSATRYVLEQLMQMYIESKIIMPDSLTTKERVMLRARTTMKDTLSHTDRTALSSVEIRRIVETVCVRCGLYDSRTHKKYSHAFMVACCRPAPLDEDFYILRTVDQ
jgi:hypothetical protein